MKIIIADDDATNRKLLRLQLEADGHEVIEAGDGEEVLEVLKRTPVDGIISDVLMPKMDGFQLCKKIRADERFCTIPFIAYTATYDSPHDYELAQMVGVDHYMVKPMPADLLTQAIQEVVAKKMGRKPTMGSSPYEAAVYKQYSVVLIEKLESKNRELLDSLAELQRSNERLEELNQTLEKRVAGRTAEVNQRNQELSEALAQVKELSGLIPICSYCKAVRDDKNYWSSVEKYIADHTNAKFSHGICPKCYEKSLEELHKLGPV